MTKLFKRHTIKTTHELLLTHAGPLSFDIIHDYLDQVESSDFVQNLDIKFQRRVINILVEVLQNLAHNIEFDDAGFVVDSNYYEAKIMVWIEDGKCFVATGNYILNKKVYNLESWLDKILSLDKEGVKKLYMQTLDNNRFSPKGGGGLGFLDITRRSGDKFAYGFSKVDQRFSYFNFECYVPVE